MCEVPASQCRQWSRHCDASHKGVLGGYWTRLGEYNKSKRQLSAINTQLQRPDNVFALTSYLEQDLGRLYKKLDSNKATLILPLITIYPASCDIAMSGVDVALQALTARPDDELCMSILTTWKRMKVLNLPQPPHLQLQAYRALIKYVPSSIGIASYFLEHLYSPYPFPYQGGQSVFPIVSFLSHFNMDVALVDIVYSKWATVIGHISNKDAMARYMFPTLQATLVSKTDHTNYVAHRTAYSRALDILIACFTTDSSHITKLLDEPVFRALCHYEVDSGCVKLVAILQSSQSTPADILLVVKRYFKAHWSLVKDKPESRAFVESLRNKTDGWANLASLLPALDHWEYAIMGIDNLLSGLAASPTKYDIMAILHTWKQLLDFAVPAASSVSLIQTTVDLFVTKYDSVAFMKPALFFIEKLYIPAATWADKNVASFYLHKLLFHSNMDSGLVDAYLSKWHSCQDTALVGIKCACLYRCLFDMTTDESGTRAMCVDRADSTRYNNQVKTYARIVEDMLVCFHLKPTLISMLVNNFFLHGIVYYGLEAECLPGLTTVIKSVKIHRQVLNPLLNGVPDKYKVDTKTAPTVATKYLGDVTQMHWLKLQKALSYELRASLYAHRRLLLDKISSGTPAEAALDALGPSVLDYLKNVYGCIDESDTDLVTLVQFTALCEQLPIGKLSVLVATLSGMPIAPPQLKLAYYKLMYRFAVAVCDLPSFPLDLTGSYHRLAWDQGPFTFRADIIQLVLNYLGFTTDIIVDNILAGRAADTLTEDDYDKVPINLLCPLHSELEPQDPSSSATDSSDRLTATARATRMKLFESFLSKWRDVLHRDDTTDMLEFFFYRFDLSTTSTSFELLTHIERLDYYQAKVRAILPSAHALYTLPARLATQLTSSFDVVVQSSEQCVSVEPVITCDYLGCWALADEIQRELSTSYLKDAIRVRASVVKNKHCITFEKLYTEYESLGLSMSVRIRDRLISYANDNLQQPTSKHDQARLEGLRILSSDAYKSFSKGNTFPLASFPLLPTAHPEPEPSSPLSTPSGSRSYV